MGLSRTRKDYLEREKNHMSKKITLIIDEEIFKHMQGERDLIKFSKDCVTPPPSLVTIMMGIMDKIEDGKDKVTIGRKNKTCK